MTTLECAETQEHAPEFALGVLHGAARSEVVAHLERCQACAATVADFAEIVDSLTLLAPESEPPAGFEDHVLRAMHENRRPQDRRRRTVLTLAALIAIVAVVSVAGVRIIDGFLTASQPPRAATIRQNGAVVGKAVVTAGAHSWIMLSVDGGLSDGKYRAELVDIKGENLIVGEFDVVAERGTWVVPEAVNTELAMEVRILDLQGKQVAWGRFPVG